MVQLLGERYKKTIAFTLVYIFYFGFLAQFQIALGAVISPNYKRNYIMLSPLFKNIALTKRDTGNAINASITAPAEAEKILGPIVRNRVAQHLSSPAIGPTQPESSTFKSAGADNMVDLFTGDFSYNIPLMDVGGYPVSIHYNGGVTMDQEASWVGLGWNLNPGTVSRSMRGLPDDFDGTDQITKTESVKENKTVSVNGSVSLEVIGTPTSALSAALNLDLGVFYNNNMGWGVETGISPSVSSNLAGGKNAAGKLTAGLSMTANSMYGASLSPSLSFSIASKDEKTNASLGIGTSYNNRTGISSLQLDMQVSQGFKFYKMNDKKENVLIGAGSTGATFGSYISFATPSYTPTITMPIRNEAYSFTGRVAGEVWAISPGIGLSGSVQRQTLDHTVASLPAYGYMNYTKAKNDPNALMDFNREKELAFVAGSTPHIAIPIYTPDLFSVSGEGIGGMFRAYRSDIGYIRDHRMQTTSFSGKASGDLGSGGYIHAGSDFMVVDASTVNSAWTSDNALEPQLQFSKDDTTYESVYFKNPGEQTAVDNDFYNALGNDTLIRPTLTGDGEHVSLAASFDKLKGGINVGTLDGSTQILRKQRDKRTQVINYFTADQASKYGSNKNILSYPENVFYQPIKTTLGGNPACMPGVQTIPRVGGIRKCNHLSEIDVFGTDGKKYMYGLPVYNVTQDDVTFSVDPSPSTVNMSKGLIKYDPTDNTTANSKGKENYYSKTETPGYAHSFLLTGIVSPDYVDVRNDGITDDDLGDAVRFNYTQICTEQNPFEWRIPFGGDANMANYNEGLKTYSRDDRGTYTYGKKEVWYLHSIESKNFVAMFCLSRDRLDAPSTNGENGGVKTDSIFAQRRLQRIELYAKADLVKNGANAKPVKTVYFDYDYSLCKGIAGKPDLGKLTLTRISFSYNNGKKKNPYIFSYNGSNPSYNPSQYDRWGNYKDFLSNVDTLSNYDYPYAVQDSVKAAQNASAWCLTDIQLPSGGKIKVTYEGDDYGYVQNKNATKFYTISGFGNSSTASPSKYLYGDALGEKLYVFANLPGTETVANVQELKQKYFAGIEQLFFKLYMPMPNTDKWGVGSEWIPMYAQIDSMGLVGNSHNQIWIKVKDIDGISPFKRVAMQFLRLNLPSKAYPNSETGADVNFRDMIKVVFSALNQFRNMFTQFETLATSYGWCREINKARTFVRLDDPYSKKYGGGHRVKRIEMFDNWSTLTGTQQDASYGKEYTYTTTLDVNGTPTTISSGVASYEPMIGGDENPFHVAKESKEKLNLLAPTNLMYSEEPLGETFFPAAMVGYSKVRVQTIHNTEKSANGFDESEFYTTKDFPTIVESSPLDSYSEKAFRSKLTEFIKITSKQYMNLSQGFKIELNNMNGKIKSQSSYPQNDANPILTTRYYYRVDDQNATTKHLKNDVSLASVNGTISQGYVGKDIEVMVDLREQLSKTISGDLGINVDIVPGGVWPIPFPSSIPFPQKEVMRFRSAAVTKVVNRYGLLDSVVQIDKGSMVSTKNVVWDGESGEVIMNRTNNEYNDPVYSLTYPAYWAYSGMGTAYSNLNMDIGSEQIKLIRGKLYNTDNKSADNLEKLFNSGDEIIVERGTQEDIQSITPMMMMGLGVQTQSITYDPVVCGEPKWKTANNKYDRIWAIDAAFGIEHNQGIYFIDQDGRPYSCKDISTFKVIRSGKRNLLSVNAGAITSLANPIRTVNNVDKIQVDAQTKVLNASAATFKNIWKVTNHWYIADSPGTTSHDTTVVLTPVRSILLKQVSREVSTVFNHNSGLESEMVVFNSPYFMASDTRQFFRNLSLFSFTAGAFSYHVKSVIDFDIKNKIQQFMNRTGGYFGSINSATLTLGSKKPLNVWNNVSSFTNCASPNRDKGCIPNWDASYRPYAAYQNGSTNGQANSAYIANLENPWGPNSIHYNNFGVKTDYTTYPKIGKVKIEVSELNNTCLDKTLNCAALVTEAMDPSINSTGFVMEMDNYLTNANSSERTLSFAGNVSPGTNQSCDSYTPATLSIGFKKIIDTTFQICKQFISDTVVNPYRFGILGNWHLDRNYVFYSDRDNRRENDLASANNTINLRTDGILPSFNPFWSFGNGVMTATADSSQWTWNSSENFFNKKGYELENYDALFRYNSGQYGYNQQLAVAATQNAKSRQSYYDGLEDYGYATSTCSQPCVDARMFDNFTISNTDSHSGLYSLSLSANQSQTVSVPLTAAADTVPTLSIKVDSVPIIDTSVTLKGTGLTMAYSAGNSYSIIPDLSPITNYYWTGNIDPVPGFHNENDALVVNWTGYIQVENTDDYTFLMDVNNQTHSYTYSMLVAGKTVRDNTHPVPTPIHLVKGTLYPVWIHFQFQRSHPYWQWGNKRDYYNGGIAIRWSRHNDQAVKYISSKNLYATTSVAAGSVNTNLVSYCVKLNWVKPQAVILPKFAPVKGVSTVVGAWVKIKDDNTNTADNSNLLPIKVVFPGVSGFDQDLQAVGKRIEGWQRYEFVLPTIPSMATQMQLVFNPGARNLLVDDIRIHPFNANMRSFVYSPETLRLMSELDENNYATFYEYDDEGNLMRVKKETERGVMTIKETRNNSQTLIQ